jgi:small subunit ribosomal protein S1
MYKSASRYMQHRAMQQTSDSQPAKHSRKEMPKQAIPKSVQRALSQQHPIRGLVKALNRGGFEVLINGVRAFCPHSMTYTAIGPYPDKRSLVGQNLEFLVVAIKSHSVIVSQRAAVRKRSLQRIRAAKKAGDVLVGTVTNVMPYGAFIDLGAIDGLIHISEITDR